MGRIISFTEAIMLTQINFIAHSYKIQIVFTEYAAYPS